MRKEPYWEGKGQEKSKDCGDDSRGEPEVGAKLARAREKKEGGVHE
jgi:hypothetical protein